MSGTEPDRPSARQVGRDLSEGLIELALGVFTLVVVVGCVVLGVRLIAGLIGLLLGLLVGVVLAVLVAIWLVRRRRR